MHMRTNRRESRQAISAREPFVNSTGSLRGIAGGSNHLTGMLNDTERRKFLSDGFHGIDYLVVSYDTPIGWVSNGSWYRVEQKFSRTTSCHQGMIPLTGS